MPTTKENKVSQVRMSALFFIALIAFALSALVVMGLWNWLAVPAVARSIDYSEALVVQAVLSAIGLVARLGEAWVRSR